MGSLSSDQLLELLNSLGVFVLLLVLALALLEGQQKPKRKYTKEDLQKLKKDERITRCSRKN